MLKHKLWRSQFALAVFSLSLVDTIAPIPRIGSHGSSAESTVASISGGRSSRG